MQNPLFDSQDQGPGAPQILWQLQEMFSHGDSEQGSHPDQQPTAATGYEVAGATCTPCRSHTTHTDCHLHKEKHLQPWLNSR